jgi:putative inorganic carbon (hco3(-)) transporter
MFFANYAKTSERGLTFCIDAFVCFLLVTVLLVPYRFLNIPENLPIVGQLIGHLPAVISIVIVFFWYILRRNKILKCVIRIPLGLVVIGLFITGVLSSLGSEKIGMSLAKDFYYFITGGLLFFVVRDIYLGEDKARRLILLFICSGYLVALYGVFEFWAGHDIIFGRIFDPANETYLRMSPDPWFENRILSSIGHPVFLGTLMIMALPISFSFCILEKHLVWKMGFVIGTFVLFVALILTFSRGAWVAGFFAGVSYLFLRGVRPIWYVISLGVVIAGVLIILFSFRGITDIFLGRIIEAYELYVLDLSATSRGKALGHTFEILDISPFMGVGTGMYRFKVSVLERDVLWPPTLDTPDNMYLLWIAERGVLGFFAIIFFMTHFFRLFLIRLKVKSNGDSHELVLGLFVCFIGFFVNMLTCCTLTFPVTRIVFWILAGVSITFVSIPPPIANIRR